MRGCRGRSRLPVKGAGGRSPGRGVADAAVPSRTFATLSAAALDGSADAVLVFDARGIVRLCNAAARRFWGARLARAGADAAALIPFLPVADGRIDLDALAGARRVARMRPGEGPPGRHAFAFVRCDLQGEALCAAWVRSLAAPRAAREALRLSSLLAEEAGRAVAVTDRHGRVVYAGRAFRRRFIDGRGSGAAPALRTLLGIEALPVPSGRGWTHETLRVRDRHGAAAWVSLGIRNVGGAEPRRLVVLGDPGERSGLQALEREALQALAHGAELEAFGALVCGGLAALLPGAGVSLLLLDDAGRLRPLASSGLPAGWAAAVEAGRIGDDAAWSTAAARAQGVIADLGASPAGTDAAARVLLLGAGLGRCRSAPVVASGRHVVGVLSLHERTTSASALDDWRAYAVEACARLCAPAIGRHRERVHLANLVFRDALTGLPNRAALREEIRRALSRPAGEERETAFMVLDLDRFKSVNDRYGHTAGDALLREVAHRLRRQVRGSDMVCRLGGDEFAIVLPGCGAECADAIAGRIVAALRAPVAAGPAVVHVAASIGISLHPRDGADEETLIARADRAMYAAKRAGGARHRFHGQD